MADAGGRSWISFVLLGAFLTGLGLYVWAPVPGGIWHDDGVYLIIGKALAAGEGLVYGGVPGDLPAVKFPPLYPALLAMIWAFEGDPLRVAFVAEVVNVLALAMAGALFGAFLWRRVGLSVLSAMCVTGLIWLSVDLWQFALAPLSEATFLLALVIALWLGDRAEKMPGVGPVAAFVLAAAVLLHLRSAGVAVAGAGVLALALAGRVRAAAGAFLGLIALSLPWILWSGRAAARIPEPLRDILGPYGSWLAGRIASAPGTFVATLPEGAVGLAGRTLRMALPGVPLGPRWVLSVAVLPLMVWGGVLLYRRSRTSALSLLLMLGLLWIWPFHDRRLIVPILPLMLTALLLPALVAGLRDSDGGPAQEAAPSALDRTGMGRRRVYEVALVGAALFWAVAFAGVSSIRLTTGWASAGYDLRSRALAAAVEAVKQTTPPDAVVGAPELWPGLYLYTGYSAAPSAPFRPLTPGVPAYGTPVEQWAVWMAAGIDHLLVEQGGRIHGEALDELESRCPGVVRVLATPPGAFLVRLDWNEECVRRLDF